MDEETHGGGRMSEMQPWDPIVSTSSPSFLKTGDPSRAWNNEIYFGRSSFKEEEHQLDSMQPLQRFSSNIPSSLLNNTEGGETRPPFPMLNQNDHLLLCDNGRIKRPSPDSCSFSFQQKHLEKPITSHITPLKVRKEKLGDRIATLQQLVSPFGKTDTASVLLDAVEYIKCLHAQLTVLCSPYLNMSYEIKETGGKEDLRSRGLCLVPISTICKVGKDNSINSCSPMTGTSYWYIYGRTLPGLHVSIFLRYLSSFNFSQHIRGMLPDQQPSYRMTQQHSGSSPLLTNVIIQTADPVSY